MDYFRPQSPDPFLEDGEDMSPAKFGHLNAIVKEVNNFYSVQINTLTPSSIINAATSHRSTIIRFDSYITSDITFVVSDKTKIQINDFLTIMTKADPNAGTISFIFRDSDFFLTGCGSSRSSLQISGVERNVCKFIFDGEKFVSTYDNC